MDQPQNNLFIFNVHILQCKTNAVFSFSGSPVDTEKGETGNNIPEQMTDDSESNVSEKVFAENLYRTETADGAG